MLNLVRLELKKINFKPYIIAFILINILFSIFISISAIMSRVEGFRTLLEVQGIMGDNMYEGMLGQISMQNLQVIMIFIGIFGNEVFIKEYNKGTVRAVFTSPVGRKNIFISKIFMFLIVSISIIIISNSIQFGVLYLISDIIKIENSFINSQMIINIVPSTIKVSIICSLSMLLPVYIGLKRKSMGLLIGVTVIIAIINNSSALLINAAPSLQNLDEVMNLIVPIVGIVCMGIYTSKDLNNDISV